MKKFLFLFSLFLSFFITAQNFSAGKKFTKNYKIYSPYRTYYMVFQNDGNLVVYNSRSGSAVWDSKTANSGNRAEFQSDGNFVIYNSAGTPVFSTNTANRGSVLKMQDDGNLVIYNGSDNPVWSSIENKRNNGESWNSNNSSISRGYTLKMNEKVYSPNNNFYFLFQTDGNLVVYNNYDEVLWSSKTSNRGVRAIFQTDGNLVIYDSRNQALFASNTGQLSGRTLKMQDDGNLVIYNARNVAVWASNAR